ncbi:hypothetical protein IMG5_061180, partial [Ichthyophthirius multifiliis]
KYIYKHFYLILLHFYQLILIFLKSSYNIIIQEKFMQMYDHGNSLILDICKRKTFMYSENAKRPKQATLIKKILTKTVNQMNLIYNTKFKKKILKKYNNNINLKNIK